MSKRWLVLAAGVAVVAAAVLVVPRFVDAERYRGILNSRLEAALGRKVKLGRVNFGLFPPALQVNDAQIAEAIGFRNEVFSTAKELRARVRLWPLLRGRLEVPTIELHQPTVELVKSADGQWNFASLGKAGEQAPGKAGPAAKADPARAMRIDELRLYDGVVRVTDLQARTPTVELNKINLRVKNFSPTQPFEWELSLHPPGREDSRVQVGGSSGPLDKENLAASPARLEAKFERVDLTGLAAFTGEPGLGGLFSGNAKVTSDGQTAQVDGDYQVDGLRLTRKGRPAQGPVNGRYKLNYESARSRLNVTQFDLAAGKAMARSSGHVVFGPGGVVDLKSNVHKAPLADIARLLPAFGVVLPAGSSLSEGTLNAGLLLRGRPAAPVRSGTVDIANGRLANFNVAGKLGSVVRLAGIDTGGKDTVLEKFQASFTSQNAYTTIPSLLMVIPGMNIDGNGGFADGGELRFQGEATLARAGKDVGGLLQRVTGSSDKIPFRVTGTLERPVFQPDVGKIATRQAEGKVGEKLLKGLGGLFGKK